MPLSPSELAEFAANLDAMRGGDAETRGQLANPPEHVVSLLGAAPSATGVSVTPQSAMSVSAVFAAIRNIAEDVAKLPLKVYRRDGKGRQEANEHPLYRVLHDSPNPEMTAMDARSAVVASAVLYGGGFAEPVRNGFGDVVEWWPIEPWRVQVQRDGSGHLVYVIDGGKARLGPAEIFHIRGFNFGGIVGCMMPLVGQDSIGLAIAAQRFAAGFFARGGVPSGIITFPKTLSEPAQDRLRNQWMEMHGGQNNGVKPAFFQDGMGYTPVGTEPQKGQMLESRKFQIEDVARWFRIPPHKIGHLERSTFSNIEHQSIEYVVDTLMPWCIRFEQESKAKLLTRPTDADVFVKHNMDALLRGDTLSRQQAREIQARNGVISIDEWRGSEDMNPLPEGLGEKHFIMMNMTPIDEQQNIKPLQGDPANDPPADPALEDPIDDPQRAAVASLEKRARDNARLATVLKLIKESLSRCVRREVEVLRRAMKKPEGFESFARQFYADHAAYVRSHVATALELAGVSPGDIDSRITQYCERSAAAVVAGDVEPLLDEWLVTKPDTETRMLYESDK